MSWASDLQQPLKLWRIATLYKEAVRIVPVRQRDAPGRYALGAKAA
jgi:hypothetical protein